LGVAAVTRGYYLQRRKASPFGRVYYEGTSVQNVNKELRRAVIIPFCRGLRSRNVMQPWPVAALV
jgi:hypothetical protein